jgi:hypothetical protein
MAKIINLQPIQEEHINALCLFLNSMGVSSKIEPDKDFVQEDLKKGWTGIARGWKGENMRWRYIKLEGMNIDGIIYSLKQIIDVYPDSGARKLKDEWGAECVYWVERNIEGDEKALKALEAKTNSKSKGLFKKELVDFEWVGGGIADVLNKDTSLKNPILNELIAAKTMGFDADIWIRKLSPPHFKTTGIMILTTVGTFGNEKKTTPLLLPPKDAFRAYDRIAKHIKGYVVT